LSNGQREISVTYSSNQREKRVTNEVCKVRVSLKLTVSSLRIQVSSLRMRVSSLKTRVSSLRIEVSSLKTPVSSLRI